MNADDPFSGEEENSQSYNSDSSSIPSYLSDFELDPTQDPPFTTEQSGFGRISLLLSCERKPLVPQRTENGSIFLPFTEGTAPLSTSATSFLNAVSTASIYTSSTLSYPTSSQVDSRLHTNDLLLAVAPTQNVTSTKLITTSESEHHIASDMSRTLPAKIRDKLHAQSLSVPPYSDSQHGTFERSSVPEATAGPSCRDVLPPLQKISPTFSQPNKPDDACLAKKDPLRKEEERLEVSCSSKGTFSDVHTTAHSNVESGSRIKPAFSTAGYSSAEEDAEVRRTTVIQQTCRSQSHTAFPIPPPPEHAESLLRHMDNLSMPNVSPDSGIQSVDSSPSGNDSPGSVTLAHASDHAHEHTSSTSSQFTSASTVPLQTKQNLQTKDPAAQTQEKVKRASEHSQSQASHVTATTSMEITKADTKRKAASNEKPPTEMVGNCSGNASVVNKNSGKASVVNKNSGTSCGQNSVQKESDCSIRTERKSKIKEKEDSSNNKTAPVSSKTSVQQKNNEDICKRGNDNVTEKESRGSSESKEDSSKSVSPNKKVPHKRSTSKQKNKASNDSGEVVSNEVAVVKKKDSSEISKNPNDDKGVAVENKPSVADETLERSVSNKRATCSSTSTLSETSLMLPTDMCLDPSSSDLPSPFRGPSMGRRKRGRPAMRKKSQMLQHKQSTLYKELYSSDASGSSAQHSSKSLSKTVAESGTSEGSSVARERVPVSTSLKRTNTTDVSHSSEPVVSHGEEASAPKESKVPEVSVRTKKCKTKGKYKTFTVIKPTRLGKEATDDESIDNSSSSRVKNDAFKRGRGRPKGSKNKPKPLVPFTVSETIRSWRASNSLGLGATQWIPKDADNESNMASESQSILDVVRSPAELAKARSAALEARRRAATSPKKAKSGIPVKRLGGKRKMALKTKGFNPAPSGLGVPKKRGRGRPRKKPLPVTSVAGTVCPVFPVKTKAVADSELASLIQSVQNSIQSQFSATDMEESNDFAMDNSGFDITAIQPSLPQVKAVKCEMKTSKSSDMNIIKKVVSKYKKPKVHVMMRNTKRKKKKTKQAPAQQTTKECSTPSEVSSTKEPAQTSTSFKELSEQQTTSGSSVFEPSTSKPLQFYNRYQPSKLLKQSSFRLQASALGSALQGGDESSDDEGSEARKKKKKKKLLNFKSKHKNIVDPAFLTELRSLQSSMDNLAISEQAFIRVKPGEVPLPSIFKLTIIDVKKKKKDRLVLEPIPLCDRSKKAKVRKDSKERETPMPELVKEKPKNIRKKSQSEETAPPELEIQVQQNQCLPPKKRHRLMYAAESAEEATTSTADSSPEKRKVGRPRKAADSLNEKVDDAKDVKPSQDRSSRAAKNRSRSLSGSTSREKKDDMSPVPSSPHGSSASATAVLACPAHAHKSESAAASCAECNLLKQSQPLASSSRSSRQKASRKLSPPVKNAAARPPTTPPRESRARTKGPQAKSTDSASISQPLTVSVTQSTSPRSRTKQMAASLPRSEVVISPLPDSAVNASRSGKKFVLHHNSASDVSDSDVEDESVIRSVCSEFEPLPLEHCHRSKVPEPVTSTPSRSSRKRANPSSVACSAHRSGVSDSGGVKRGQSGDDSQPPRKRYQRVGLFSDFYKDDPKKRHENMTRTQSPKAHGSKGDQTNPLLPPPIHFGKHFRETESDFQLPYDIWWQYTHDALPKIEAPRPKFKTIRSNVYVDIKPNKKFEPHPCSCKRPTNPNEKGCKQDDLCLNRMLDAECTPGTCPCGEQCSNQRIQKQDWASNLEKFVTDDRGFGVRTLKTIEPNRIIMEYLGEVVSEHEFRRRMTEEYSTDSHHYCLKIGGGIVIDGYRMGNLTRFVNHSCEPNCSMQKWNVNGLYRMVLQTQREIKPYEEITYDYQFDPFNAEAQQECRCGSKSCRGVIGKNLRNNNGQVGLHTLRSSTRRASTTLPTPPPPSPPVGKTQTAAAKAPATVGTNVSRGAQEKKQQQQMMDCNFKGMVSPSLKPMSQRERVYARRHSIFLVRNIDRARGERRQDEPEKTEEQATLEKVPDLLCMKDIMNDHRSVRTRLGALADENPELLKLHRLAVIFDEIYNALASLRDESGTIMAGPLTVLPSRRRYPDFYKIVAEPIDMTTIRNNIKKGHYADIHVFDADIQRLFKNVELYCGKRSEMGKVIAKLRTVYQTTRTAAIPQIEEVIGESVGTLPSASPDESDSIEAVETKVMPLVGSDEEDVIRCICGIFRDEGMMIMCEKCMIWQHCECVKVNPNEAGQEDLKYFCELCDPRQVDKEILDPQRKDDTEGPEGETVQFYLSLMRDSGLQVSVGDCVYIMKDFKRPARSSLRQSLVAASTPEKMEIFRVEELFKNAKGEKFCAGNLYLRPHETFHEPNRTFYHNELFRYPIYETYALEQVAGKCFVMDFNTFCRGKPKGFDDKDIYICETRVDKTAHFFTKIIKKFPINTKSFCFEKYPQRIRPPKTYKPHDVPEEYLRRGASTGKKSETNSRKDSSSAPEVDCCKVEAKTEVTDIKKIDKKEDVHRFQIEEDKKPGKKERQRPAKRERLNSLLLKMLAAQKVEESSKQDLSYLLEETIGKRPRKKPIPFC